MPGSENFGPWVLRTLALGSENFGFCVKTISFKAFYENRQGSENFGPWVLRTLALGSENFAPQGSENFGPGF